METKYCSKCKQIKPISEFYKSRKGGCKKCIRAYQNQYYKDNYATPEQKEQLPDGCKRCSHCRKIKTLDLFYGDKSSKDGYGHRCKKCDDEMSRERKRKWEKANPIYTVPLPKGYKICSKCLTMYPLTEFYKANGKVKSACKKCEYEYKQSKVYKGNQREYQRQPEVKKKIRRNKRRYRGKPENLAKERAYQAEYNQRPEVKHRNKKHGKRYRSRPENQEKARQRTIEWRKANPEKARRNERIRYNRQKNIKGRYTVKQWETLCNFFEGVCPCCGQKVESFELDHIIPLTWPGTSNYISNAQPLCKPCNCAKGNHRAVDYRPARVREWAERETRKMKQAEAEEARKDTR